MIRPSLLQPAARLALGYGKEAVQAVSATDAVELIADLQSQMSETTAAKRPRRRLGRFCAAEPRPG